MPYTIGLFAFVVSNTQLIHRESPGKIFADFAPVVPGLNSRCRSGEFSLLLRCKKLSCLPYLSHSNIFGWWPECFFQMLCYPLYLSIRPNSPIFLPFLKWSHHNFFPFSCECKCTANGCTDPNFARSRASIACTLCGGQVKL